jgi:cytochrome c-type biogenesis protein CcmE
MKPKHTRLLLISISLILGCAAVLLLANAFRDGIIYFYTPSELQTKTIQPNQPVKIGGLVQKGSYQQLAANQHRFVITDNKHHLTATYIGILPALFREGSGVIAEGVLRNGQLNTTRVLAKHDEAYMPKKVYEQLRRNASAP